MGTDVNENLTTLIAELKRRREEIDTAIESLVALRATGLFGAAAPSPTPSPAVDEHVRKSERRTQPSAGSRAERVRRVFTKNRPEIIWTSEALAEEIGEPSDEQTLKAIHGILSRLRKADAIEKVGRGEYRVMTYNVPVGSPDPGNSSGPADDAGPEASVTTTGERSDPHAQDLDHDHLLERNDRDDHRGAAVGVS